MWISYYVNLNRIFFAAGLVLCTLWMGCQSFPRGERIFNEQCASCHMTDGTGLGALLPSLQYSEYLAANREDVSCLIRYGSPPEDTLRLMTPMPAFPDLSETDISNLINYMNTSWGNDLPTTSPDEVAQHLGKCTGK